MLTATDIVKLFDTLTLAGWSNHGAFEECVRLLVEEGRQQAPSGAGLGDLTARFYVMQVLDRALPAPRKYRVT